MLRLLFTTEDNVHQMTVVTDGIDGQMKVFVTESLYGDVEYYKGLGIVIESGHAYNIGQFKEWAFKALVKLIAYPEGFGEESIVLSDVQDTIEYVLETDEPTLNFPAKGGDDMCVVTSSKQTFKNGQPVGHPEGVPVTFSISGTGFNVDGGGQVTVDENPNNTTRKAVVTVKQNESGKTLQITCNQAASTVSYEYALTIDPTSVTFDGAGGEKLVTVTSTRTKVLNGVKQQPETYPTDIEMAGVGFDYKVDGNNYKLTATENTASTQRTGKATISQDGGKTAEVTITQNAATVTYDYVLTANSQTISFVALGETKVLQVVSTRQKRVNGQPSGGVEKVDTTAAITGTGFSQTSAETTNGENYSITVTENKAESTVSGKITVTQSGSNKTVEATLTQAAATVTYEYACAVDPTTLSFVAAGETKVFGVTATKQKKINGKNEGAASALGYTTVVSGTGFTKGSTEYSVIAAANTGAQRTGTAVVTTVEGNKTATVTLTQLAGA